MKKEYNKKRILILSFTLIIVLIFAVVFLERERFFNLNISKAKSAIVYGVYIGNVPLWTEVADTEKKRQIGLSEKESLKNGQGMLFIFDEEERHGIWMKDMNFPIDIVWINKGLDIVDIKSRAEPESYPEVFLPAEKSLYIVEMTAGFLYSNDIKIGQKVILKIF